MAEYGSVANLLSKLSDLNLLNFENIVKEALEWNRMEWEEVGEEFTAFKKLVNSIKYWNKKLKAAQTKNNVILTVYKQARDSNVDMLAVIQAIEKLNAKVRVTGISEFRNPRYMSIYFETEQMKKYVEENLKKVGEQNVAFLSWAHGPEVQKVKIHWLPKHLELKDIGNQLKDYFIVVNAKKIPKKFNDGRILDAGLIELNVKLKDNIKLQDIPHIFTISECECLITVDEREAMCLSCYKLGHKSYECPTPFCSKCRSCRDLIHVCKKKENAKQSYAEKIKGNEFNSNNNKELLLEGYSSEDRDLSLTGYKAKENEQEISKPIDGNSSFLEVATDFQKVLKTEPLSAQTFEISENEHKKEVNLVAEDSENVEGTGWGDSQTLESITQYMNELKNIQLPNREEAEKLLVNNSKSVGDMTNQMEWSDSNLKRKLAETNNSEQVVSTRNKITWSYSKKNGKPRSAVKDKPNLFDSLSDEADSVFN